tara:strand:- start:110 stop:283 length:174 start_codon:yes stop_codon:yes gene_type:complete
MKRLLLSLLNVLIFPLAPLLSHGYNDNCNKECNDYYCPPEHRLNNQEKIEDKIPSKN